MKWNMLYFIRALRLEFTTGSIFPYLCGSFLSKDTFSIHTFTFGFIAVLFTHLSANLINDYADSMSGVDWHDIRYFKFFGGSKLIQQKIFSESFYKKTASVCAALAGATTLYLAICLQKGALLYIFGICIVLAWMYSLRPFSLSYRRLGEFIVFLLFGLMPVGVGYYLQTGAFFALRPLVISFPFGFLITAVLFINEVPDFTSDLQSGKYTWVSITGPEKAYYIYGGLQLCAACSIIIGILYDYFHILTLCAIAVIVLSVKSIILLKKFPHNKARLILASKLTILEHGMVSIILIIGSVI